MIGKISDRTCRLNFYVHKPDGTCRTYSADAWGYGQLNEKKCLVIRDTAIQKMRVLGAILPKTHVPKEDRDLVQRVHIVEEGLMPSECHEYRFMIEPIDDIAAIKILNGPLIEPARLVGDDLYI
ncbi:hypothetical protein KKC97_12080 [bacterium]|nr:hypothetical protein [bacterium]MBU1638393.1 hypothetical protein [bacterium]